MPTRVQVSGPLPYRLQSAAKLCEAIAQVSARRMLKGPRRPGWNWFVEVSTEILRKQLLVAFSKTDINQARAYLNSLAFTSQALAEVDLTPMSDTKFRGTWVVSNHASPRATVLYLHGGGYAFYPQSYAHFFALITLAANTKTFALDYPLAPEHPFPAQLENALNAYRWLIASGTDPEDLVVMGDSAGGNLALTLLLALRESHMAMPALAIALCPATDFETDFPSMTANEPFDWIQRRMLVQWADWFCGLTQRTDPFLSPRWADLRGLAPIYIQAGRCEILYDSIQAFADSARKQGANVVLETWEDMNHDFQMFGDEASQSTDALKRIGEVIDSRVGTPKTAIR